MTATERDRYGEPSRRPGKGTVALAVLLLTAGLAWVAWASLGRTRDTSTGMVVRYHVVDAHSVRARIEVLAPRDRTVACTVEALSASHETVGRRQLRLPPTPDRRDRRSADVEVRTRARAVTATVAGCVLVEREGNG